MQVLVFWNRLGVGWKWIVIPGQLRKKIGIRKECVWATHFQYLQLALHSHVITTTFIDTLDDTCCDENHTGDRVIQHYLTFKVSNPFYASGRMCALPSVNFIAVQVFLGSSLHFFSHTRRLGGYHEGCSTVPVVTGALASTSYLLFTLFLLALLL